MHVVRLAALLATSLAVAACSSTAATDGLADVRSSLGGGLGRNTDTYGTNRRVDVYGGSTAPSLPSIGAPGFGK